MKKLLTSTTALSIALFNVQPWPLLAQTLLEDGRVVASDGTVLCEPLPELACDPALFVEAAAAIDAAIAADAAQTPPTEPTPEDAATIEAQRLADEAAAVEAQRLADEAAAVEAQRLADDAAAVEAQRLADDAAAVEAQRLADDAAAVEAQRLADEAAAVEAQRLADDAAAVEAQRLADDAAAVEAQRLADEAAAIEAQRLADEAAAVEAQRLADDAAAVEAQRLADDAAAVEAQRLADDAAAVEAQRLADEAAAVAPAQEPVVVAPVEEPLVEPVLIAPALVPAPEVLPIVPAPTVEEIAADEAKVDAAIEEMTVDGAFIDPTQGLMVQEVLPETVIVPVDAPVVQTEAADSLNALLLAPQAVDPVLIGAAASVAAVPLVAGALPATTPAAPDAVTTLTETITEQTQRASTMEFAAAPVAMADGKKSGLSNLEKVGLLALGALVVGSIINEGKKQEEQRVVSNTGDRVIVLKPDGTYQVYKDDDVVLRQPGSKLRTETFQDGSTRTIIEKPNGTQIVTIRDASGRVLRRAQYDGLGRELVLIDDLYAEEAVIVTQLPKPRKDRIVISTKDGDAALRARLAAKEAAKAGRSFSLRQIRDIPEVRALGAMIDVDTITFDSGSAAIKVSEADDLADLGSLMQDLLAENPAEMFLIEGHTDATGKAALNLALSDRRAESVALALTEYFDIPPENMVIQGYGETELRIDTQANESRNRRVAVRLITPLLRTAAN